MARQLSFDDEASPDPDPGTTVTRRSEPGPDRDPRAAAPGTSSRAPAPGAPRQPAWDEVEAAVSAIRARYGNASVGPAALVGRDGLAVKERGDTQWGPSAPPSVDGTRPMTDTRETVVFRRRAERPVLDLGPGR